ncbi:MAG: hypothetical protein U0263_10070 [Polyangiaceae bacterium]
MPPWSWMLAGHERAALDYAGLGGADGAAAFGGVALVGANHREHGARLGEFGFDEHVYCAVLERLEGADGNAELLALHQVAAGHPEDRL